MILAGILQGKRKPPFYQYASMFTEQMNKLYNEGIDVDLKPPVNVKLAIIRGTLDLPAKAELLNMTYYNGHDGCNLCEEPGKTVAQGKGHSHYYPYHEVDKRHALRIHQKIKDDMNSATKQN